VGFRDGLDTMKKNISLSLSRIEPKLYLNDVPSLVHNLNLFTLQTNALTASVLHHFVGYFHKQLNFSTTSRRRFLK
jgi:hypothetical protein